MLKDGICRVRDGFYTKTISYEDINYSVASSEDQSAIFDGWCGFAVLRALGRFISGDHVV